MIGLPPVDAGAVQVIVAWEFPAAADGLITAEGTDAGVDGLVVAAGLSPLAFVATIENVYAVPLVKPVTVQVRAPLVVQVKPPGDEVTV